jgi:hypothetical protein
MAGNNNQSLLRANVEHLDMVAGAMDLIEEDL